MGCLYTLHISDGMVENVVDDENTVLQRMKPMTIYEPLLPSFFFFLEFSRDGFILQILLIGQIISLHIQNVLLKG